MNKPALLIALLVSGFLTASCVTSDSDDGSVNQPAESSESITVIGTVTNEGVECPAVRGDDGMLYTVTGEGRDRLTPGARVRITGIIAQVSFCMQGTTINAAKIEVL
jgi:hypothetical protein